MSDGTREGNVNLSRERVPVMCRMRGYAGLHTEETTEGYEFHIEGYRFVVHRTIRAGHRWSVTEPMTGLAIVQEWGSRRKAIWMAETVIAKQGGAKAIAKALKSRPKKLGFKAPEAVA